MQAKQMQPQNNCMHGEERVCLSMEEWGAVDVLSALPYPRSLATVTSAGNCEVNLVINEPSLCSVT